MLFQVVTSSSSSVKSQCAFNMSSIALVVAVFLVLASTTAAQYDHSARAHEGPSSTTYFETGNGGSGWTAKNPLKISHAKHFEPSYHSAPPMRPLMPRQKLVRVSFLGPPKYNKKYFTEYINEPKPYKPTKYFSTPVRPTVIQVTDFVPVREYSPKISRPFPPTTQEFSRPQQPQRQQQQQLNVPMLIDKFGLVGMKPLLSPEIARQQAQPPLEALESALSQNPFAVRKGNRVFVPVNNQPVAVPALAVFLRQAQQGNAYLDASPTAVLDSELIEVINSNRRRYGFEEGLYPNQPKSEEMANYIDDNEDTEYADYLDEVPSERRPSEQSNGVQLLAPDFKALPKSRRFRTATLGSLGYQN